VPNPSFEDTLPHTGCISYIETANQWFNPSSGTPDFYSYKPGCINSSLNNFTGYQLPRTGLCYPGIYGYLMPSREYIAIKLDSNLSLGCTYYIEFFVSRANSFGLACDKIGVAFTDDTIGFKSISTALPLIPAIQSPPGVLLSDTMNWMSINGYYTANGTERFLIIGNFYNDINTTWDTVDVNALFLNGAYYYIDDVTILQCGVTGISLNNAVNNLAIQHLINTNEIKISGSFKGSEIELVQTDLLGRELLRQKLRWENHNALIVKINDSSNGMSFITLKTNNFLITKKIIQ
jgi:hypothetical protein